MWSCGNRFPRRHSFQPVPSRIKASHSVGRPEADQAGPDTPVRRHNGGRSVAAATQCPIAGLQSIHGDLVTANIAEAAAGCMDLVATAGSTEGEEPSRLFRRMGGGPVCDAAGR